MGEKIVNAMGKHAKRWDEFLEENKYLSNTDLAKSILGIQDEMIAKLDDEIGERK